MAVHVAKNNSINQLVAFPKGEVSKVATVIGRQSSESAEIPPILIVIDLLRGGTYILDAILIFEAGRLGEPQVVVEAQNNIESCSMYGKGNIYFKRSFATRFNLSIRKLKSSYLSVTLMQGRRSGDYYLGGQTGQKTMQKGSEIERQVENE